MSIAKRLVLGTAQFGFQYGVANNSGQVELNESSAIVDCAWAAGIDSLDTAISYGESEQRLGEIGIKQWQVITKLPVIPVECSDVGAWVEKSVRCSLERLRVPKIGGLLLHHPQQLLSPQGDALYRALLAEREEGRVGKIGISIYSPKELDALCSRYRFDLVQAPYNILDRSLDTSGWLNRLNEAGTEVHVRSIFLQGLLLMDQACRPTYFNRWQSFWVEWHSWLREQSITPIQACLGFVMSQPKINRVVLGVDSLKQLRDILLSDKSLLALVPTSLTSEDIDLINPSRWKNK
jgi:aryl-alcohol dehydrogenase-like predicted oxidoreductase